jgi:hypothetical protein
MEEITTKSAKQLENEFSEIIRKYEEGKVSEARKEGWKVVRSKRRKIRSLYYGKVLKTEIKYRVLRKGGEIKIPLLSELGIKKWQRYTEAAKNEACIKAVECNTYRQASQITGISRMSIWNWVQNKEIPTRKVKSYSGEETNLSCESDRFYISIRNESYKQPVHLGLLYNGKKEIGSNGKRPYRSLMGKEIVLSEGKEFVRRFEGAIHSRIGRDSLIFYSSDEGEPAKKRAGHVVFTEKFIDYYHISRSKLLNEPYKRAEWEKSKEYKGYFGSCESNVKVAKKRLAGRTWSFNGLKKFLMWMSYVVNGFNPINFYFPLNERKKSSVSVAQKIYPLSISEHIQKNIFHHNSDEWTLNRAIDSGKIS